MATIRNLYNSLFLTSPLPPIEEGFYFMKYSEKLKDPRWQKKRLEILERDNFTCVCCKDTKTELHIHHSEYKGEPWDADSEQLATLCKHCHKVFHYFRMDHKGKSHAIKIESSIYEDTVDYYFMFVNAICYFSIINNEIDISTKRFLDIDNLLKAIELHKKTML